MRSLIATLLLPNCLSTYQLTLAAVLCSEVERTAAVVSVDQVHAAGARRTAARRAARHLRLAVHARVAWCARARVPGPRVRARGAVLT